MSTQNRRPRRLASPENPDKSSWEKTQAFRHARQLMRAGQYGLGLDVVAPFRGAQLTGSQFQIQDRENT